jgi:hypothetical protein
MSLPYITERPHPDFEKNFRAYCNYLTDLSNCIGGHYGVGDSLLDGVHAAVLAHPPIHKVQRLPVPPESRRTLELGLRKGWGFLRRVQREVEDEELYDEEANALMPYSAWYAVHHVGRAFAAASRQTVARDHVALLRALATTVVKRDLLPFPWGAWCGGCPELGTHHYGGLTTTNSVHVLSRPSPDTVEDRLAMVLRTTRHKNQDIAFDGLRRRNVAPGRGRRNLDRQEKENYGAKSPPTTIFDFLYRLRTRASYGEADLFVLGSRDEDDARQLAVALAVVCDATVAALEALIASYTGPATVAEAAEAYAARTRSTLVRTRAEAWRIRVGAGREPTPLVADDIPF